MLIPQMICKSECAGCSAVVSARWLEQRDVAGAALPTDEKRGTVEGPRQPAQSHIRREFNELAGRTAAIALENENHAGDGARISVDREAPAASVPRDRAVANGRAD